MVEVLSGGGNGGRAACPLEEMVGVPLEEMVGARQPRHPRCLGMRREGALTLAIFVVEGGRDGAGGRAVSVDVVEEGEVVTVGALPLAVFVLEGERRWCAPSPSSW